MKREEKEISPYLLPTGYIMESCPMPWKCQERKGRSEGEKEDGQRKKREEKRKGERMREIALLTIRRIFKDTSLFLRIPDSL